MSILHFGHLASSFDHWLMGVPKPEYDVAPHDDQARYDRRKLIERLPGLHVAQLVPIRSKTNKFLSADNCSLCPGQIVSRVSDSESYDM